MQKKERFSVMLLFMEINYKLFVFWLNDNNVSNGTETAALLSNLYWH